MLKQELERVNFIIILFKGLFTPGVCVPICININVNFIIELMVTHTHRIGLDPFSASTIRSVDVDIDVDANGHAHATSKQSLTLKVLLIFTELKMFVSHSYFI